MTFSATIIVNPDDIVIVIGRNRFAVHGALARGLRALAKDERARLEAAVYTT